MEKSRSGRRPSKDKNFTPKNPPRVTVEMPSKEYRTKVARAVRRLGYMDTSSFVRAMFDNALEQADALPNPNGN